MDLSIQNFRGIRKVNPTVDLVSQQTITAVESRNVELRYTDKNNNIGIFTVDGNKEIATCPHKIIGQWESVQNRVTHHFVYAVNDEQGYIYEYNPNDGQFTELKNGLTPTAVANGITLANGFYDWFVFSNGVDDYVGICLAQELEENRVKNLNATDAEGRPVRGLCLKAYDGRLATNSQNRIHWSKVSDIFTWNTSNPDLVTEPAYQELDRDVTALEYYNDTLIAFTDTYSVAFKGNPGDAKIFEKSGATGGGCASFGSVIKIDNKVLYFDYEAKNIFAYYLIDSGQTRPTNGVADNVIKFFADIDKNRISEIEIKSYINGDRSEIWFKLPHLDENKILIFDYLKSEWIERQAQADIRAINIIDNQLLSASGNKIMREYFTNAYNGEFVPAEYLTSIINIGSDSNLKVPKMPLIITLDTSRENDFFIEIKYDDNPDRVQTKRVQKTLKGYLIWAKDEADPDGGIWAEDQNDPEGLMWFDKDRNSVMFNLSGLRHFKQMQMRIYTKEKSQEFGIKRLELKRVKTKTKTLG